MYQLYVNENILCAPRIFEIKTDQRVDKTQSKMFQFNFASFSVTVIGNFFTEGFDKYDFSFCLEDIMYFSLLITWLYRYKEAVLTKSLLLCKSYDKSSPKSIFFSLFQMMRLS